MPKWEIARTVELCDEASVERLRALATTDSCGAHELRIRVQRGGVDAPISRANVRLLLTLPDGTHVQDDSGSVTDSVAAATLPKACYQKEGEVRGVLYLMQEARATPVYAFVMRVAAM